MNWRYVGHFLRTVFAVFFLAFSSMRADAGIALLAADEFLNKTEPTVAANLEIAGIIFVLVGASVFVVTLVGGPYGFVPGIIGGTLVVLDKPDTGDPRLSFLRPGERESLLTIAMQKQTLSMEDIQSVMNEGDYTAEQVNTAIALLTKKDEKAQKLGQR